MRNLFYAATLSALAACGISEEDYSADYSAKYCESLAGCGGEFSCDAATETATDAEDPLASCEVDSKQAEACLDAEWTCDDLNQVVVPAACETVYTCPSVTTVSGT